MMKGEMLRAAVLEFWFGAPGGLAQPTRQRAWFAKDAAFDAAIHTRFGGAIERALAGELAHWAASPEGALAQVLLLDQLTRNAFRGTARAFAGDALALEAARRMLAAGQDMLLPPLARAFVYLPFEHAEALPMQLLAVDRFSALAQADPALQDMLDYARAHHAVIARFGRFPHRNEVLGRISTAEEVLFLREPGSRF